MTQPKNHSPKPSDEQTGPMAKGDPKPWLDDPRPVTKNSFPLNPPKIEPGLRIIGVVNLTPLETPTIRKATATR
jgi:hypothetical protein